MSERDTMPDWVAEVIRARAIVGALGEPDANDAEARNWWPSRATSQAGRAMLAQLFPRTAASAALTTVSRAAALVHEERIGQPHVVHLFRLPTSDEVVIGRWLSDEAGEAIIVDTLDHDAGEWLNKLRGFGGDQATDAPAPEGPQRLEVDPGDVRSIRGRTLRRACMVYARAFAAGTRAFPFVDISVVDRPR